MMNDGHGVSGGGADGPATAQEVGLVVGVDTTAQVNGQLEIQEAGGGPCRCRAGPAGESILPKRAGEQSVSFCSRPDSFLLARQERRALLGIGQPAPPGGATLGAPSRYMDEHAQLSTDSVDKNNLAS